MKKCVRFECIFLAGIFQAFGVFMVKKCFAAAFLFCALNFFGAAQNFDVISEIMETKKITVGGASYLAAQYAGTVDENSGVETAYEKMVSLGCISSRKEIGACISLQDLCGLYAKALNLKGGMMFSITKKSGRYAYKEFRAKGYIPPHADPSMSVSGVDAIGLLNRCHS